MKCSRCQQENPVGAQFCGQCGAQLDVLCVACQVSNPPANRFCHRCGQRLTTAAGPVLAPTVGVTHDDPSVARSGDGAERYGSTVRRRLEGDEMPDPDREPDDIGSPGSRAKPVRLCIVSRDRFLTGEFLKTLEMTLDPDDELEFIPDRRRANQSMEAKPDAAEQPSVDRRRHLHVDSRLKLDGFAIVLAPATGPRAQRPPSFFASPRRAHRADFPRGPGRGTPLEGVRNFKRKGGARLATSILAGLVGAVVFLVALSAPVKTLVSRVLSEALSVTVNPAIVQPSGLFEASSPVRAETPPTDATRESPVTGLQEPTPSGPARTATPATGRAPKGSASARVVPNPRAPAPPRPTASVLTSPVAIASPPDPVGTRITAPQSRRPDEPEPLAVINWLLEERR
jgi:Double zinc ribbon